MSIAARVSLDPPLDQRASPRHPAAEPAILTLPDGTGMSVTIRDHSAHGFRVTLPAPAVAVGDRLGLRLQLGPERACWAVWMQGRDVGFAWAATGSRLQP